MSTPRSLRRPPSVRRTVIDTDRGSFAALEARPPRNRPRRAPALLVPGFTGSKEDFLAVLHRLARSGRRVVAIDMRGQYETPGPDDRDAYTCAALGADVAAVLSALAGSTPVHLLGHSFGGLVTRETVLGDSRPPLASFTLMSSGPSAITGPREEEGRLLLAALPEMGLDGLWKLHFEPEATNNGVPPDVAAFLRDRLFANSLAGLLGMADEILCAADRVDDLAARSLSTLVIYGAHDDAWSPQLQAEMAARLGAEHVVVPDAAHSPAVEAPDVTARALTAFWNAAELAPPG